MCAEAEVRSWVNITLGWVDCVNWRFTLPQSSSSPSLSKLHSLSPALFCASTHISCPFAPRTSLIKTSPLSPGPLNTSTSDTVVRLAIHHGQTQITWVKDDLLLYTGREALESVFVRQGAQRPETHQRPIPRRPNTGRGERGFGYRLHQLLTDLSAFDTEIAFLHTLRMCKLPEPRAPREHKLNTAAIPDVPRNMYDGRSDGFPGQMGRSV